jgi:uncharacterized protein (DUF1501 family)
MSSRRDFLRQARAGAMAASVPGLVSALHATDALAAPGPEFKALVCIFLFGGSDSHNMVIPADAAGHASYAGIRQALAIPRGDLLPMTPASAADDLYGFHPQMSGMHSLFEAGKLSVVANVGTITRPTTKAEYLAGSAVLPPRLFSHNTQRDYIQSLGPLDAGRSGWAGRASRFLPPSALPSLLPANLSFAGYNLLQADGADSSFAMGLSGPAVINGALDVERAAALDDISAPGDHLFQQAFADVRQRSLSLGNLIRAELEQLGPTQTTFSSTRFSQSMRAVSQMIAVSDRLNMARQIFFVSAPGWDTHSRQNEVFPGLVSSLSNGIAEFQAEMQLQGLEDQVLSFTLSDFGRTLTSNGDGSDHGWGSHQFVVGGGIAGGQIVGSMPDLSLDGPDDIGRGRMLPAQGMEQYGAAVSSWLGLQDADLDLVFPNLANFGQRTLDLF